MQVESEQHAFDIKKLNDEFKVLKQKTDSLDEKKLDKDDFHLLRSRVDKFENLFNALKRATSDIEKRLKGLGFGGGGNAEQMEKLDAELKKLRYDFDNHAEIAMNQFGVIEQVLPTKADKSELIDLQN